MPSSAVQPIIPGFYPDPTICRVGDDYYLANSSFEYFPGAPLWHSRDLVTWERVGNILTSREQFVEGASRPSNGIYGSTLRHHDGLFYFITTNLSDYGAGQLIVTASDPAGPWSAPVWVPQALGIDPDLAWDDDGVCLLTWHYLDFETGEQDIRQAPIDTATGMFLEPAVPVWQGSGLAAAEGPHLYRIGRWWYLVLAEGGTERGHCVTVARSLSPRGPFEGCPANPVFTKRSTVEPVQSVGHADLVRTPAGEWAAVYLGTRPRGSTPGFHVLGRETFVAGIEWRDDWPVFVDDAWEVEEPSTAHATHFSEPDWDAHWVVPEGVLPAAGRGLVSLEPDRYLCTRVTDFLWTADAVVAGEGGLEVRMDRRHAYGVTVRDGLARAFVRIGGIEAEVGRADVAPGDVTVRIAAVDPGRATVPLSDAGPDDIVLSVASESQEVSLARIDGRYLSTEVAAGFTGRMLALGAAGHSSRVRAFSYQPSRDLRS
ncbi:family 43 glycosylhydrolase [Demequina sp.]|uniref:glycoside hydrolase family 43 protein n=1 Tax=Demequina sp. TaxID=2050685 RepID=UPI003A893AB5